MAQHAEGVAALYRLPGNQRGFGAFIRPAAARVGDDVDPSGLGILYHAVAVAVLDGNPSRAGAGMVDDYNTGHRMCA